MRNKLRPLSPHRRWVLTGFISALFMGMGAAQAEDRGVTSYLYFGGSSNSLGQIYKLDPSLGYRFNKHFAVNAGLPFYLVRASADSTTAGFSSKNGVGNAYLDLRFTIPGSRAYFSSRLRGAAPTGDKDRGFSTGRATVDWTNYLEGSAGKFAPFASLSLANSVSDTHFFSRPFSSLGFVSQVEAGTSVQVSNALGIGASAYAVIPGGQQKVFSRLIARRSSTASSAAGGGQGQGKGQPGGKGRTNPGPFETESVTVGSSDIARDHGVAVWLNLLPSSTVNLELGYSRSVRYAFDTVFFSIGFNLNRLARNVRRP